MANPAETNLVDLSHMIEHGMTTYKGLPGPHICDFWSREGSAANYDDGSRFQIGRIDMVANTGTYVDAPFHRYADGADLAQLPLESLAELPGLVVRRPYADGLATDASDLDGLDVRGADGNPVLAEVGDRGVGLRRCDPGHVRRGDLLARERRASPTKSRPDCKWVWPEPH